MEYLQLQNIKASLIARQNEAPDNPLEPYLYQLRQRFYRRPSRPGHSWSSERRRPRGRLLEELIKFRKFWSEPHRDVAQWHVGAARRLYPEFREQTVFKGLLDASPGARVRHWRDKHQSYPVGVGQRVHVIRFQNHWPSNRIRHLRSTIQVYQGICAPGCVICRTSKREHQGDRVLSKSWQNRVWPI